MSLYRANAPWLTEVFVDVEVRGLVDDWREVVGSAQVPAHEAAEVGRALVELAERGCADKEREVRRSWLMYGRASATVSSGAQ
jgi:hypothetical protein